MQSFTNLLHLNTQHVHTGHSKFYGHFPHSPNAVENGGSEEDSFNDSSTSNSSIGGSSPKVEFSSSPKNSVFQRGHHHNHHHHSIQELIRHFGKKVHNWRADSNVRRNSCVEDNANKFEDSFRSRSKSLDTATGKRVLSDCEATYRIYDSILKEGAWKFNYKRERNVIWRESG